MATCLYAGCDNEPGRSGLCAECRRRMLPDERETSKPKRAALPRSDEPDAVFVALCEQKGFGTPEAEHRFHPDRRWRFDYAWPDKRVALEVEGGVFIGGRHVRGAGFRKDAEKYNEAAVMGWTVLRVLPEQLKTAQTLEWIERAMSEAA